MATSVSASQAKKNRAHRVAKMAEANKKRRAGLIKRKKLKEAEALRLEEEKAYVRAEKKRLREEVRDARRKLAMEKKKLRKPAKPVVSCSMVSANELSIAMTRLVPSAQEISKLTHAECTKLRSDMSKILSGIRGYAKKCNPNYGVAKKKTKAAPRRSTPPLKFRTHEVYIPDIGYDVPDEIPVSEREFYAAQKRLKKNNVAKSSAKNKKVKKRIQPQLVARLPKSTVEKSTVRKSLE